MKGMRIAVVVIAVVIVAVLGVALMTSGGRRRAPAPAAPPREVVRNTPPVEQAKPVITSDNAPEVKRTVAEPPVQTPAGMDPAAEEATFVYQGEQAKLAMIAGEYDKALEMLREQNKTAAKLAKFNWGAPVYIEIARLQLLKGDYERARGDLKSVLLMSSVGRSEADPKVADDVQLLAASIELAQGNLDAAEAEIAKAREMRTAAEGADNPALAEVDAHAGLLADLRGNHDQADELLDNAYVKMSAASQTPDHRYIVANNLWLFRKSAEVRAEKLGQAAPQTNKAARRARLAEESL